MPKRSKLLYIRDQISYSQEIRQMTQKNRSQKLKEWNYRLGFRHKEQTDENI